MIHQVDHDRSQQLLLHTDQEVAAHKAAELWVDYDMKRLDEMRSLERQSADYHASTYGIIGFRHVKPLESEPAIADARLDRRLTMLCEQLRAKY